VDLLEHEWRAVARQLAVEKFSVEWNTATAAEEQVLRAVVAGVPPGTAGKGGGALAARLVRKGLLLRRARGEYAPYHPLFADYVRSVAD